MGKSAEELREYNRRWFKGPRGRYHSQKSRAIQRGIEFLLTFDEWWDVWQTSGKWEQRGKHRGQYVMARFGDQGAYELGNVKICPVVENVAESNRDMDHPAERRSAVMKAWWASASKEKRKEISRKLSINSAARRPEVRAKLSAIATERWRRHREKSGA